MVFGSPFYLYPLSVIASPHACVIASPEGAWQSPSGHRLGAGSAKQSNASDCHGLCPRNDVARGTKNYEPTMELYGKKGNIGNSNLCGLSV